MQLHSDILSPETDADPVMTSPDNGNILSVSLCPSLVCHTSCRPEGAFLILTGLRLQIEPFNSENRGNVCRQVSILQRDLINRKMKVAGRTHSVKQSHTVCAKSFNDGFPNIISKLGAPSSGCVRTLHIWQSKHTCNYESLNQF